MSETVNLIISSSGETQTEKIASDIGKNLRSGEVIELVGDIGAGKTTFVRGLADGAGSQDNVSSPSFTISKIYRSKDLDIYHFDFYRLSDPGILTHDLAETISNSKAVTVIEWGEIVEGVLPKNRLSINFIVKGDDLRQLEVSCPSELQYLIKDLK